MADPIKPNTPSKPAFNFDKKAVDERIAAIKKSCDELAGKADYNPFLFWQRNVVPLTDRLAKGEATEEIQKAILSLPPVCPKL